MSHSGGPDAERSGQFFMGFKTNLFAISAMLALPTGQVNAQAPVAVVEEVESSTAGVEFMDYLNTGQTIQLSPKDRLVIGYMKSCWRETITGGTVTIGAEQSDVSGGAVERVRVRCGTAKRSSTSKETTGSGAMVFRNAPKTTMPDQTVYSLSPIFECKSPGNLVMERLDKREKPIQINASDLQLSRRSFIDLSKANVVLTAGGLYRVKSADAEIVIKVDPSADLTGATIIGRLVRLLPPS